MYEICSKANDVKIHYTHSDLQTISWRAVFCTGLQVIVISTIVKEALTN